MREIQPLQPELLFGYSKGTAEKAGDGLSVLLYEDGTLIYESGNAAAGGRELHMAVSAACLGKVRSIIDQNIGRLRELQKKINGREPTEGENRFLFRDVAIVDWDLARWFVEEDRKKHPEYYSNSVRIELVETYVRGVFDEICGVIESDEKVVRYMRTTLTDL